MLAYSLIVSNLLIFLAIFLVYIVLRFLCKVFRVKLRYRKFGLTSLGISLVFTLMVLYGYTFGRFTYEVNEMTLTDERLPDSFDGYRIVHISDLHLGGFKGHEAFVDTIVNKINSLHPDLICFTGDLVSFSHEGAIHFIHPLRRLKARDGVISILGNHDYAVYERSFDTDEKREADRAKLITLQRDSMDWRLLLNEHFTLRHGDDSLCIIGLENQACSLHRKVRRGDLAAAVSGTEGSYSILLSHDPSQWDAEVVGQTEIPLTLSGHTHAMQFKVFGWTPCRWLYKHSDGLYLENDQRLYINIGVGELLPFRIGATPEITLITLQN